jgi:hypothetical protein
MPLRDYGVFTGKITGRRRADAHEEHYLLRVGAWEVAINARGELEYAVVQTEPMLLADGWTPLARGLDYIRGDICAPSDFRVVSTDLNDLFDEHLRTGRTVHAFGTRYDVGDAVHNVHQNQGNEAAFADDDGVWQDGGLIVETTAILLRFSSQSWDTDESTGHTDPHVQATAR